MNSGAPAAQSFRIERGSLPGNAFSRRAERLLLKACGLLARFWPLLVGLVYLDCAWVFPEERRPQHIGQIGWHLAAIALANVLATLGRLDGEGFSLPAPAPPPRARFELCLGFCLLPVLLGLSVFALLLPGSRPLALELPVRLAAAACSLLLALALLARMGCLMSHSGSAGAKHE